MFKILSTLRGLQRVFIVAAVVLTAGATSIGTAAAAPAAPAAPTIRNSAQTCISEPGGLLCTYVNGGGNYVNYANVDYDYNGSICNYSAWFYYVPPTGGAYGLGSFATSGCNWYHVWYNKTLNRTFPHKTQICAKFFKNHGQVVGSKCVGLS